jgi:hypothetical protein
MVGLRDTGSERNRFFSSTRARAVDAPPLLVPGSTCLQCAPPEHG